MKLVIQRVTSSSLYIDGSLITQIKKGLVVLIGISKSDSENVIDKLVKKLLNLRVFEDENSKMNYSILDIEGEILLVSQFTLYADTRKGNRPSFINAADPKNAEPLYNKFLEKLHIALGDNIKTGRFGANMQIELVNDVANSTYSISAENATGAADTLFVLTDNAGATDGIKFAGADGLLVERTDANTITFRAPSGASGGTYTAEDAQDAASQLFVNGTHTGISFTYNDANNTIDATVTGSGGGGTTYDLLGSNTTSNNAILTLRDANNNDDTIEFTGSNGTDISWDSANNKITINSTAPVQPDWDATSGLGEILNKPTIPSAYTLPAATTSTLGGVIPDGTTITVDANGNISAATGGYVLPTASDTVLGGIKIGSGLSIDGNGVVNATGGSTVPQIQDLTGTTGSVADNNTTELNITGYKAYALFKITVDTEAWVRVYVDDASRDADLTRSEGQDPTPGSGVIAEVRTSGAESILTSPGIMGFNNDNPRTDNIYLSVTNRSGNPTPITVTLTALQIGE